MPIPVDLPESLRRIDEEETAVGGSEISLNQPAAPVVPVPVPDSLDALGRAADARQAQMPRSAIVDSTAAIDIVADAQQWAPMRGMADAAQKVLERVTLAKGAGDAATLNDAVRELEKLGAPTASIMAGAALEGANRADISADFVRFLQDSGLWAVRDALPADVVSGLRAEHTLRFAIAKTPLSPAEHAEAADQVILQMLDEARDKVNQELASVQNADPKVLKESQNRRAMIESFRALGPDKRRDLVDLTFRLADQPWNAQEEARANSLKLDPREAFDLALLPTRAKITAEAGLYRAAGGPINPQVNVTGQAGFFEAIWGEGALDQLRARYHNEAFARNVYRLGFAPNPDGTRRPGYFDGVKFVDSVQDRPALQRAVDLVAGQVPAKTLEALAHADPAFRLAASTLADEAGAAPRPSLEVKIATGGQLPTIGSPEVRLPSEEIRPSLLLAAQDKYGDTAAFQRARELRRVHAANLFDKAQQMQAVTAPSGPPAPTPYEESQVRLGRFTRATAWLLGAFTDVIGGVQETAKKIEARIAEAPAVQRMAQDATFFYTGNAHLAEATKTPSEAFQNTFRAAQTLHGFEKILLRLGGFMEAALDQRNPQAVVDGIRADLPVIADEDFAHGMVDLAQNNPAAVKEIAKIVTRPVPELVDDYLRDALVAEEGRQARLAKLAREGVFKDWNAAGQGLIDVVKSTVFNFYYPILSTAANLAEDPVAGSVYLGLGAGGERAAMGIAGAKRALYHKAFLATSIKNSFASLLKWAPDELALKFRGQIGRAMTRETTAKQIQAMEGIQAIINQRLEGMRAGRPLDRRAALEIGEHAVRAWGAMDDLFPAMVAEQLRARGAENSFVQLDQKLFGRIQRPNRAWTANVAMDEITKNLANYVYASAEPSAVRTELKSFMDAHKRAPSVKELSAWVQERRVEKFVHENGRPPSDTELKAILPAEVVSLPALLHTAENAQLAPHHPILYALGRALGRADGPRMFERLVGEADRWLADAHYGAIEDLAAQRSYRVFSARQDLLAGVAEHKIRNRLTRLETLKAGLASEIDLRAGDEFTAGELRDTTNAVARDSSRLVQVQHLRDRLRRHKYDEPWASAPGDAVIWEELDPETLYNVFEHHGTLFGGNLAESVVTPIEGRPAPGRAAQYRTWLATADRRVGKINKRLAEIEADPLRNDAQLAHMDRMVKGLGQRRARLGRLAEQFAKPYSPEAVLATVGPAHQQLFRRLPKRIFSGAATVDDAVQLLDGVVRLADRPPAAPLPGRAGDMLETAARRLRRQGDLPAALDDMVYHDQTRGGGLDLKRLDEEIGGWTTARDARRGALADRTIRPDTLDHALMERERLRDLRRGTARAAKEAERPIVDYVLDPNGVAHLRRLLRHEGSAMKDPVRATRERIQWLRSLKALGADGNPMRFAQLPFFAKARDLHSLADAMNGQIAASQMQVDDLLRAVNRLSPDERRLLGEAQRRGLSPSELVPGSTRLDAIYNQEFKVFSRLARDFYETGFLSPEEYTEIRKLGYDPQLYGMYERPRIVRDADVAHMRGQGAAKPSPRSKGGVQRIFEHDELMLRRDVDQWRVRVNEPGRILEQKFNSLSDAGAWMRRTYSDKVFANSHRSGAFLRGRTPYGDEYVIARPLGRQAFQKMDPIGAQFTPEKRLKRLSEMYQNYYRHAFVQALNLFGGAVLDDTARNALLDKYGRSFGGQFFRVPNDRRAYGDLAGKWLHKQVYAEMAHATRLSDSLHAVFTGLREAYDTTIHVGWRGKLSKGVDRLLGWDALHDLNTLVKNTQILWNPATWVANFAFNIVIDHMAGTGVFDSRNVHNLMWALKHTFPGRTIARDRVYLHALEDGVVQGTFFQGHNTAGLKAWNRMVGFDEELSALKQLRGRRQKALSATLAETGGRTSTHKNTLDTQAELAAIDAVIGERTTGLVTRMAKGLHAVFSNTTTVTGLPASNVSAFLKRMYNSIDELYKLAAYKNLYDTKGRTHARWTVRTFAQDYSRVPDKLKDNPLASLVVSFPHEMARLSANYARLRPYRLLAALAVIPGVNMTQMSMAGIDSERMFQLIESRGATSPLKKLSYFMGTLMWFNPQTKNLDMTIGLRNLFPFFEQTTARGIGALAVDKYIGIDNRSFAGSVLDAGIGFTTQFVLNNPFFNTLTTIAGYDPISGKRLADEDASFMRRIGSALKVSAQQIIPPLFPYVGRTAERVQDTWRRELNPKTQRGYRAPAGLSTETVKALLNVDVRGQLPTWLDKKLGATTPEAEGAVATDRDLVMSLALRASEELGDLPGYDPEEFVESQRSLLRGLVFRMHQESLTDQERAAARREFEEMIKVHPGLFGRARVDTGPTAKQVEELESRLLETNALDLYSRLPLDKQAAVMAEADRKGVHDQTLFELVREALTTERGIATFDDPERVRRALDVLRERAAEEGASPRFAGMVTWIRDTTKSLETAEIRAAVQRLNRVSKDAAAPAVERGRRILAERASR